MRKSKKNRAHASEKLRQREHTREKNKEKNPQNLLPIVMEVASGERSKMNVFGNDYDTPDGTCLRDYIHVNDLAVGHVKAIEMLPDNGKIATNLATGNSYSVLDVINKSSQITNKEIKYSIVDRREGDPDKLFASSNNILNYRRHASYSGRCKPYENFIHFAVFFEFDFCPILGRTRD